MREDIEHVADAITMRWKRDRSLDLQPSELALVCAYLRGKGVRVERLPDARFQVERDGTRAAYGAAQLLLMGLRCLLAERRATTA